MSKVNDVEDKVCSDDPRPVRSQRCHRKLECHKFMSVTNHLKTERKANPSCQCDLRANKV